MVANRRVEVDGVEVLGLNGRGIAINPDTQLPYVAVVASMMAVELSRPLLPFLVSNDLFEAVGELSPAPPVQVDLSADEDPYDGRTWRVHCVDESMATALLDRAAWEWLEQQGRRSALTLWIDGRHVVASQPMSRADRVARRLVGFHQLVERRLASGELDAWAVDPPYPEVTNHSVGVFDPLYVRDGGWSFTPVDRELLFFLWKIRPASQYGGMFRGEVDDTSFVGLDEAGLACVVMLPLERAVPDHVHFARRPLVRRDTVTTEWLDFNDDFTVRSSDERVGHQVTSPRLMEYLYDHRVHRLDVKGDWIFVRLRRPTAEKVRQAVRVMAGARELLPRHGVG
ncbi:hypothetical protein [Luteococcus sp.]|uniref:hypothetical protein n=1 Tax=Luteococcus sp. TaxID=1969402 RepID=UPI00373526CC